MEQSQTTTRKSTRFSRLKVGIAAVAIGALLVVPGASADTNDMGVTITGGVLSNTLGTTTALTALGYSHTAQPTSGVLAVGVDDARGTDDGWTATLATTDFVSTGDSLDIPAANFEITGQGTVTDNSGLGNSADVSQPSSATPASIATATQIASAAAGGGSGNFSWNSNMTLNVPAGQHADTYTGTITLTTATAPIA